MKNIANQNFLFELVRSLTKAEKRYFKLYGGEASGKHKNYIRLFDIIAEQKENDNEAIKKNLLKHGTGINFNFAKNYLKNIVVESLVSLHANATVDSRLGQMISAVKLLRKKVFYTQSKILLKRAENLAIKAEQFNRLLDIYSLQSAGLNSQHDIDILEKKMLVSRKIDNLTAYYILSVKVNLYGSRKDLSRSRNEISELKKILADSGIMKDEKSALSISAKIIFHHINAIFHYFSDNHKSALNDLYKRLQCQEELPFYINDMPLSYRVCLGNIIASNMMLKDYAQAEIYLNKLMSFPAKYGVVLNESARASILHEQYFIKLLIYINTGKVKMISTLLVNIEDKIIVFSNFLTDIERITFYYYIAYAYFTCQNFIRSIDWLNKIIDETDLSKREDFHSMVRILNIINHYELGRVELISYLERSARRFIKQKNRMYKTETVMFRFFRKGLLEINHKNEAIPVFKELKNTLKELFKDPFEARITEYFDFMSWIDSKIENRSFNEIKKANALKRNK
ncbi:MAG: hypothetical protein IT235_00445 [Bacteroidia bacterium]|nr:hypothetical protein [Bacteroidia bacterium]